MAKLHATEVAVDASRHATQVFGGSGFSRRDPGEPLLPNDAKVLEIGEGGERDPASRDRPRPGPARLGPDGCDTGSCSGPPGASAHRALREVIRHPMLELVGVLVYDPAKDGVDAGELCGEAPVGVPATIDPAAIRSLTADSALYMPRRLELDDVVDLLEAGTNVVTTRGELFGRGHNLGDDGRARVAAACERGASSIYTTGAARASSPTRCLRAAVDAASRRVDRDRGVRQPLTARLAGAAL